MHVLRAIPRHPGSYALLSGTAEADEAVFFVHGFSGSALGTWLDFPSMIDQEQTTSRWTRSDLYFYGYRSGAENVSVLTNGFLEFVDRYFPEPDAVDLTTISQEINKLPGFGEIGDLPLTSAYKRLTLVGHSLGGVIVRQAIVERARDLGDVLLAEPTGDGDILSADIRLFAPAIFGFLPTGFGGYCYAFMMENPIIGTFLRPMVNSNATISELIEGSRRLSDLQTRTEALANEHTWIRATQAHVIFGSKEHVVYMDRFACDPVYLVEKDQDHKSVCKPNQWYRKPLDFVTYEAPKRVSA